MPISSRAANQRMIIGHGLVVDSRRALWLESHRTLVVADLHLGYAWAHRQAGQLLPVSKPDNCLERLSELIDDYRPTQLILLGDIVHRTVDAEALAIDLARLNQELGRKTRLIAIEGNHDRHLQSLLARLDLGLELTQQFRSGEFLFTHGDRMVERLPDVRIVMGHEHPSIRLDDGVASSMACPCFLVSDDCIVLPSFSLWSAGCPIERGEFFSPILANVSADSFQVVAIVGSRLLPLTSAADRN